MSDPVERDASDRRRVRSYLEHRDEIAFRDLYRHHSPAMFGLAVRLVGGNRRDAEDVLQTAWLRAGTRLAEFRWQSRLSTWLAGFVVNCARETNRRRESVELAREPDRVEAREPSAAIDVERALNQLPARYREVLVLHDIEGYTHREIAECLGIHEGTSKSQLCRARRAVRRWFAGTDAQVDGPLEGDVDEEPT